MEKLNERQKAAELVLDYLVIVGNMKTAKDCAVKLADEMQKQFINDNDKFLMWNHIVVEILSF